MKYVIELPFYSSTVGGVIESLKLASRLNAEVRFQRRTNETPIYLNNSWTIGLPDRNFPSADVVITYSDNPYLPQLVKLPQVKKVLIYMLSYGMSIDNERRNVHTEGITVMCSTKKIEQEIQAEGVDVHRVGFALDMGFYTNWNLQRKNYLAIYHAQMPSKRYSLAFAIANRLCNEKLIEGIIAFGAEGDTFKYNHNFVTKFVNATKEDIASVFNSCKCFLMPSVSEGLNLTPIEATLCGCPSVLCDGAIDEIFFDELNCKVAEKDNEEEIIRKVVEIFPYFENYSSGYEKKMREVIKDYTWDKVINNITALL